MRADLDKLSDARGSIVLGWLLPGVFYIRLDGDLAGSLGAEGSERFATMLASAERVVCFVDTFDADQMDFSAKGAFLRAFMSRRKNLGETLVLVRTPALEAVARMVAEMVGGNFTMTRNQTDFQARVDEAAPRSDWRRRSGIPPRLNADN
jgi:hypothetical protein